MFEKQLKKYLENENLVIVLYRFSEQEFLYEDKCQNREAICQKTAVPAPWVQ